jgi:DnaK suppressor protein
MSDELAAVRARLEQIKADLLAPDETARDATRPVVLDQTSVGRLSRMDAMQGQAMAVASQARRQLQMRRIDAALARLDAGEYGFCTRCGEDINPRRLEFDPTTPLCIECATKDEP